MPTDSFQVAEALPSISRTIKNERTISAREGSTISHWYQAMVDGGWTLNYAESPKTWIKFTVHIDLLPVKTVPPISPLLPGAEVCAGSPAIIIRFPGGSGEYKAWAWDTGRYESPPCNVFELGTSKNDTYQTFIDQIASALQMMYVGAEDKGGNVFEVKLENIEPGPIRNGAALRGWAGGQAWYGGWTFLSGVYRDSFLIVTSWEGPGYWGDYGWGFRISVNTDEFPQEVGLWLDPGTKDANPFRICVCPYQMAIWLDKNGDGDLVVNNPGVNRSLFISMPWVPDGFTGHSCFAFYTSLIIAAFREHFQWTSRSWFDNGPWHKQMFGTMFIPLRRSRLNQTAPDQPDRLTTSQGLLLVENAYVTAIRDPNSQWFIQNRLAGKLWNCAIVHDRYAMKVVEAQLMGGRWIHVSSNGFGFIFGQQKGSVWWRVA